MVASLCLSATFLMLGKSTVAEIARFDRGTQIRCPRTKYFLNLEGRNLHFENLRLMLKILYAGCCGVVYLQWLGRSLFMTYVSHLKIVRTRRIYTLCVIRTMYIYTVSEKIQFPWITLTNINVILQFLAHIIPKVRFTKTWSLLSKFTYRYV